MLTKRYNCNEFNLLVKFRHDTELPLSQLLELEKQVATLLESLLQFAAPYTEKSNEPTNPEAEAEPEADPKAEGKSTKRAQTNK